MSKVFYPVKSVVTAPDFNFAVAQAVFKGERNGSRDLAQQRGRLSQRNDVVTPAAVSLLRMRFKHSIGFFVGIDVFARYRIDRDLVAVSFKDCPLVAGGNSGMALTSVGFIGGGGELGRVTAGQVLAVFTISAGAVAPGSGTGKGGSDGQENKEKYRFHPLTIVVQFWAASQVDVTAELTFSGIRILELPYFSQIVILEPRFVRRRIWRFRLRKHASRVIETARHTDYIPS